MAVKSKVALSYILMVLIITAGTVNTVVNKCILNLSALGVYFKEHKWIFTCAMFIGEHFSIYLYLIIKCRNKNKEITDNPKNLPPPPTKLIFCISSSCCLIAVTLYTFALIYLTASMFQMLKGIKLIFVCLWSKIFLKNKIYNHQILGISILILGLFLVGLNSIIHSKEDEGTAKNALVGIIIMIISQFFSSCEFIIQELFFKKYYVHPFQCVGCEGIFGAVIDFILLVILQNISCDSWSQNVRESICFNNKQTHESVVEDSIFAFKQFGNNPTILILFITYMITFAMYNMIGVSLTKLVSSTARAIVDTVKTVFIWLFFLCFSPVPGTKEQFWTLQLFGFIFLVFGSLIYNEIIIIKLWGLDKYTRKNLEKKELNEELVENKGEDFNILENKQETK